ncbi:MAG: DedA family protein [Candidatus Gracilibacteria bacterium]|nr:DedA family protein [Candidatus Gracilibacteria bacterium]
MLSFFLSSLLIYKYAVLFLVIATASFGFPIPATALLIAAGAFAAQGYFDLYTIFICGFFASTLGDVIGYCISFRYGRDILVRIGLKNLLISPKFQALEILFARHSTFTIFSSRFLTTSLGPTVNILAGLTKITYKKFLFYDIAGEFIYVILFAGLGYIFSDQWETISRISGDTTSILVLIIILLVLFTVLWRARNGKK